MHNKTRAPFGETEDAHIAGLEVRHRWGETVVDTCHFRPSAERVHVGTDQAWQWEFLGVDMGFVDSPWHRILPWVAPVWSEVRTVPRTPLGSDPAAMAGTTVHTLCHWVEDRWEVALLPGWTALRGGTRVDMPEPGEDGLVRLGVTEEVLEVVAGTQTYELRQVPASRQVPRAAAEVEPVGMGFLSAFSAAGMALAITALWGAPPSEVVLLTQPEDAVARLLQIPPPAPAPKTPVKKVRNKVEKTQTASSRRGRKNARSRDSVASRKLNEEARKAGIFSSSALDDLLGSDAGLSSTLASLAGNLRVKGDGGASLGGWGLGDRHGLGDGPDVDGLGDVWGVHDGTGTGPGKDGFGIKDRGGIDAGGSDRVIMGTMTPDQVDLVIKRHLSQIRFCYQRQLPRDPHLSGKVSVRFVIAGDGTVSLAKVHDSSLGNEEVERCIVDRFFRMQFPQPLGNGTVIVKYPFLFTPG